jgi:hypothetical protein
MGRDEYSDLHDKADEMDLSRWDAMEQSEEREKRLEDALTECQEKGVSVESLRVLAFETGSVRWALEASIKREKTWFKD